MDITNLFPKEKQKNIKPWILLSIFAIALSGIFSILLVFLRTPGVEQFIPFHNFFRTSLVVHVDLSVLVWFLSIAAMLWSIIISPKHHCIERSFFFLTALGTVLIAASPFTGEGNPIMNNYVPVLQNLTFFLGISFFACGISFQMFLALLHFKSIKNSPLNLAIYCSALITFIAVICFVLSSQFLKSVLEKEIIDIEYFYELIFWAGGHALQFTYTQIMLIAWILIANSFSKIDLEKNWINTLSVLNVILSLPAILPFFLYSMEDMEFTLFYTEHMKYAGGIVPTIAGAKILSKIIVNLKGSKNKPETSAFITSIILFFAGGFIGWMIMGVNVTIPAHYHGSIVGVTLSLMGLIYFALPKFGYGNINGNMALWQPYIYGGGQLLHVAGLAWSGGYGALRKTPGAEYSMEAKAGLALMGTGGMLAIIGGLIFVIVALKSIMSSYNKNIKVV